MGLRPRNSSTAIENRKSAVYFTCRVSVKLTFIPISRKTAKYFYFPRGCSRNYRKTPFYFRNSAGNWLFQARNRNPEMAFFDQEFGVWLLATELTTDNLEAKVVYSRKQRHQRFTWLPTSLLQIEAKVYSRSDISEITAALFLRRSAFGPAVFWI